MNKHHDEICRLAKAPDDTKVWWYWEERKEWCLENYVSWSNTIMYVVDDGFYVEDRKAFKLGAKIQYKIGEYQEWRDTEDPIWNKGAQYRVKPDNWYDDIEEPVLCWVSDIDAYRKERAQYVCKYDSTNFFSEEGVPWKYATPVSEDELTKKK